MCKYAQWRCAIGLMLTGEEMRVYRDIGVVGRVWGWAVTCDRDCVTEGWGHSGAAPGEADACMGVCWLRSPVWKSLLHVVHYIDVWVYFLLILENAGVFQRQRVHCHSRCVCTYISHSAGVGHMHWTDYSVGLYCTVCILLQRYHACMPSVCG